MQGFCCPDIQAPRGSPEEHEGSVVALSMSGFVWSPGFDAFMGCHVSTTGL